MTIPIITLGRLGDLPLVSVTDYTLDGPTTATVGFASDQFVVTLGAGTLGSPVRVTPSDGGAGGSSSWRRSRSRTVSGRAASCIHQQGRVR